MKQGKLIPWKRFVQLILLDKRDILQIIYYAVFSGIVALSLPLGIQAIINLIQGAQISTSWIVLVSLVTLGVAFSGLLQLMQLRIIETIQQRIFVRSSFELSYLFPKIKMEKIRGFYPPELANRFFDILSIQKGLSKILIDVPAALLQILFALVLLSFYDLIFIVFGIVLIGTVFLVFRYTIRRGLETSLEESKHKYKVVHWIQEVARSIMSFKLSGRTSLALTKNDGLVKEYLNAREDHFSIIKFQFIKMIGFKSIITAGLLIIGGSLVLNQRMNIGQFVATEIIILLVINSLEKLILGLETFYDTLTSVEKLGRVIDQPIESQKGEKINLTAGLNVSLTDVTYQVPNRQKPILSNISMDITPKSKILIQGESGAGKSTLLRTISGISSPSSGSIHINGLALTGININNYRTLLGLSLSEELPFEGTLRENLTFGDKDIEDSKVLEILNVIGLSDFLRDLPHGLNSQILAEGKQIAYTVAKKIVLARAIIKQPRLLILEDALNQFTESESKAIIDYLCSPEHSWSIIVVSRNEHWNKHCTQIIHSKEGEINIK